MKKKFVIGNIIIIVIGIINTKVMSNFFTVGEFGIITLILSTLALATMFAKGGLHQAFMRYYVEYEERANKVDFFSTYYLGVLFLSILIILFLIIINNIFFKGFFSDHNTAANLSFFCILFMAFIDMNVIQYRIKGNPQVYVIKEVFRKALPLIGLIVLYFTGIISVTNYIIILLISTFIILMVIVFKNKETIFKLDYNSISKPILKEGLKYGIPALGVLLSSSLLNNGDKYIIKYFLSEEKLGMYSAAYLISSIIQNGIITPLNIYIVPNYIRIWKNKGKIEVENYLNRIISYYYLLTIPMIFGSAMVSDFVVITFTSEEYINAAELIPIITAGIVIYGLYIITSSGLIIAKKTNILFYAFLITTFVNIVLNILTIPHFGIIAAAFTTLISYLILLLLTYIYSKKQLDINLLPSTIISGFFSSIVMFLVLTPVNNSMIKLLLGPIVYSLIISIFNFKLIKALVAK